MDVDQVKVVIENVSCDTVKRLDGSDKDATMGLKNSINLSSSPLVDKGVASLCPITPFSNKESVYSTSKVISPSTVSSSMSIDHDVPSTPMEDVFDSLAAGRDKFMKHGEKSESFVARKLNFNSGDKECASDSRFEDGKVMESVYESILEGIISKEAEDILSEIVAADVLMTPPSAPRLSGIAETCPGAPMKPATKLRNIDSRLCRKLEF
ncbi:cyclin-dependent protein kinase inhibitor SMR11-like protein [Tanacetum coccineum]